MPSIPPRPAAALLAAALAAAAPPAHAQAVQLGRALYETRCIACHASSVQQRESRRAADFGALRDEVARWAATAGGAWLDEEIDSVTAYVNDRWYRYPCPETICRAPARAALEPRTRTGR